MARFKVLVEYEGTRYSGWQVQKNARTIQGELIRVARDVFKTEELDVAGSGRTDAGVHALRQAAHLDVRTVLAPEIIRMKLNDGLPADINILDVEKARSSFHARHDAVARSYLYQLSRRRTALGKRYVWWVKDPLDAGAMRAAARQFVGMKDMGSFTTDDPEEKQTKVLVEEVSVTEAGDLILLRFVGSHFLWKMVRQIVGVLAEVGRGAMPPSKLASYFRSRSAEPATFTAPPSGLFLERVYYPGDRRLTQVRPVLEIQSGR